LATKPNLVTVLKSKTPYFGDKSKSRHHFESRNALFWRRDLFSSLFWVEERLILTTRSILVTVLSRNTPTFGDETNSRRRFEVENALFWRRE
jgi:hypothetical protein